MKKPKKIILKNSLKKFNKKVKKYNTLNLSILSLSITLTSISLNKTNLKKYKNFYYKCLLFFSLSGMKKNYLLQVYYSHFKTISKKSNIKLIIILSKNFNFNSKNNVKQILLNLIIFLHPKILKPIID
jgi:hypothetical protein